MSSESLIKILAKGWLGYAMGIMCSMFMVLSSIVIMNNYLDTYYFNIALISNIIFSWALIEIIIHHPIVNKNKMKNEKNKKT